jgi:hypothetical protein
VQAAVISHSGTGVLAGGSGRRKRIEPEHWRLKVHWHVTVTYPASEDGHHERVFEDLHLALDWANEMRRSLLNMAYHSSTEVTDQSDRKEGVIRRYYVSDGYGAPLAIIEIRSCFDESHV